MKRILLLISALLLMFSSCGRVAYLEESFFSMDTFMYVKVENASSQNMRDVKEIIYDIEKAYGKNIEGSCIREFNLSENGASFSPEQAALTDRALEIAEKTDGSFDPTLGALTEVWESAENTGTVPSPDDIDAAKALCGYESITSAELFYGKNDAGTKLDFGGIAKGYAAEKAIVSLKESGIENAMLNLGGNIAVIGESEANKGLGCWSIGIKDPFCTEDIIGVLNVTDCFISVSGAYERFYEVEGKQYHHILNRKTGLPSESDIESAVAVSSDGTLADALSTALFVMGAEEAKAFYESGVYDFEMILIMSNGEIFISEGLGESFKPL